MKRHGRSLQDSTIVRQEEKVEEEEEQNAIYDVSQTCSSIEVDKYISFAKHHVGPVIYPGVYIHVYIHNDKC